MNKADQIIAGLDSVQPLSQATLRLLELLSGEDHSVPDVIRVIEADPGLTLNVLRYANSAALNRGGEVTSLDRAVSLMGGRMVLGVALAVGASGVYGAALSGYEANRGELWRHSLRAALACRELARYAKQGVDPDVAYTAGILHDIGKAVISEHLKGEAPHMLELIDEARVPDFILAERELLGTDHAEIGARLGERWGLPGLLIQAIMHHHGPRAAEEKYRTICYITHLGDLIAMMGGSATGADAMMYPLDGRYQDYICLSDGDLERVMLLVTMEFDKTKDLFFGGGGNQPEDQA